MTTNDPAPIRHIDRDACAGCNIRGATHDPRCPTQTRDALHDPAPTSDAAVARVREFAETVVACWELEGARHVAQALDTLALLAHLAQAEAERDDALATIEAMVAQRALVMAERDEARAAVLVKDAAHGLAIGREFAANDRAEKAEAMVHLLYDLVAEGSAGGHKQYDYEARAKVAIQDAQRFLREKGAS